MPLKWKNYTRVRQWFWQYSLPQLTPTRWSLGAVALAPPAWSPDGRRLAFQVHDDRSGAWSGARYGPTYLYTVALDELELQRVAEGVISVVSWSPDGQRLAVAKAAGDNIALVTLAADGSDEKLMSTITVGENYSRLTDWIPTVSWSRDGTQILYSCNSGACVVNVEDGKMIKLVEENLKELGKAPYLAAWSPDGMRIAIFRPAYHDTPPQLFTVARDGSDRRDLVRLDEDGNLVPANPPEDES